MYYDSNQFSWLNSSTFSLSYFSIHIYIEQFCYYKFSFHNFYLVVFDVFIKLICNFSVTNLLSYEFMKTWVIYASYKKLRYFSMFRSKWLRDQWTIRYIIETILFDFEFKKKTDSNICWKTRTFLVFNKISFPAAFFAFILKSDFCFLFFWHFHKKIASRLSHSINSQRSCEKKRQTNKLPFRFIIVNDYGTKGIRWMRKIAFTLRKETEPPKTTLYKYRTIVPRYEFGSKDEIELKKHQKMLTSWFH